MPVKSLRGVTWPAITAPAAPNSLAELADRDGAMVRGGKGRDQGGIRLFFEGDQLHFGAAGTGALDQ